MDHSETAPSRGDMRSVQRKVWLRIEQEIDALKENEGAVHTHLRAILGSADGFTGALSALLSHQLFSDMRDGQSMAAMLQNVLYASPWIGDAAAADLDAFYTRDPACQGYLEVFFFRKGFAALQAHRVGHALWLHQQNASALLLQARCSMVYNVDIHPAARLGRGIFLDHANGVVIGETSVVEDDVSILQEVTLGGTGKERGDRHPKVRKGALLCAGVKILGNIEVGAGAKVGAGSVVLHPVPAHSTVVGVPARVVGFAGQHPALDMDQALTA
ncbi:serine O-acetyltransferase [Massilia sp. CF038]|uniref:serine O-acetyltransferase n=1 Tax=Massilia sp. CF038 TaxID=1881045 RepID=UPI001C49F41F|nr:serine O-acetyltransferase [Massilia sp. CF038]